MSDKLNIVASGEGQSITSETLAAILECGYLATPAEVGDSASLKTLLTNDEFNNLEQQAINKYWEMNKPFSDPVYICAKCGGGMCRENNMVYTSNPPCYRYVCNKCNNSEFRHI